MIQVRFASGATMEFSTLKEAFRISAEKGGWKVSFNVGNERVRLIKEDGQWVYEDIYGNREGD